MSECIADALNARNEDFDSSVIEHIGTALYDKEGQIVWAVDKNGGYQRLLDIRGWGAIQHLFKTKDGLIDEQKAMEFQDKIGRFVAFAINEKIREIENVQ